MDAPLEAGSSRGRGRRWAAVAVVLAMAVAAALWYVLPRTSSAGSAGPPEKLTIALSTTPHAALLHLAHAKGFFAREGLDLTIKPVSHGKAALDLLVQGQTDLAAAAEVPFVISVLNGEPLGIAATVLSVSTEMAIVARRDRAIAQPVDLLGKRVGVTFGTSGEYFLWAFLTHNKLAPERVVLVDVAPGQMSERLAGGGLDAVSTWEPVRSRAQEALGAAQATSFSESNAYTVTHVVVGRNEFLAQRARAVEKMVRALVETERFIKAQPQEALALAATQLKMDPAALRPVWQALDFRVDLRQSQLVTLEDQARWAIARGYAKQQTVPNFLQHLYLGALLSVSPDRVTVVH